MTEVHKPEKWTDEQMATALVGPLRPLHETLPEAIRGITNVDYIEFVLILLDMGTKIHANHDGVVAAIEERFAGLERWKLIVGELRRLILTQKILVEAEKARSEAETREETVEVEFETIKVGDEILHEGERCKLGQYSVSKFVMILTGPKNGHCLEKYPGPKDKVQKIVRKGE